MFKARISLDHVWPQLESGMSTLLNEFCKGIPFSEWMTLYTYVLSLWGAHKDHSEQNTHARKHTRARARPGGVGVDATQPCARLLHHDAAELGEPDQGQWRVLWGEDLYAKLVSYLKAHLQRVLQVRVVSTATE